ncbi:MAG TPA: UDP-N-acetylglucosamine 2-epimerase [Tepidisphaeraceae bacterium]|jgi:UDP-N-acetylglucosamine 2-epimerase|nr:UDP-N-acetylglucosamine 2-epimerase [Tepidisphaeraceae bacterium]
MPREIPRRVCFVTGTRAEFGLMRSVLRAIEGNPSLRLQLAVTGMHLDRSRGRSLDAIRRDGWTVDAVIPWPANDGSPTANAIATGKAIASLAAAFAKLKSDIALVVGDRVEAFAAASAAHLCGIMVAHVHGGDRALGLVDDSLRHAITKLAHIHFPATKLSAQRIERLGEDRRRILRAGSPGLDEIQTTAAPSEDVAAFLTRGTGGPPVSAVPKKISRSNQAMPVRTGASDHVGSAPRTAILAAQEMVRNADPTRIAVRTDVSDLAGSAPRSATARAQETVRDADPTRTAQGHSGCSSSAPAVLRFALLVLHPQSTSAKEQQAAAEMVLRAARTIAFDRIVIVYPNNDPGSAGISRAWDALPPDDRIILHRDLPRPLFLGLMRDAAVLMGNSSSGIIEAASFGTPVLDIGTRQAGREHGENVAHAAMSEPAIARALRRIWNRGTPIRFASDNPYGGGGAGRRIAAGLARVSPARFMNKLIAY